jgi:hypothetical protein
LIFIGVILILFERRQPALWNFSINNLAGVSIIDLTGRI